MDKNYCTKKKKNEKRKKKRKKERKTRQLSYLEMTTINERMLNQEK